MLISCLGNFSYNDEWILFFLVCFPEWFNTTLRWADRENTQEMRILYLFCSNVCEKWILWNKNYIRSKTIGKKTITNKRHGHLYLRSQISVCIGEGFIFLLWYSDKLCENGCGQLVMELLLSFRKYFSLGTI